MNVMVEALGRKEQKQRPWRNDAYQLDLHDLVNLLSYRTWTTYLEVVPLTVGWAISHQALNKNFFLLEKVECLLDILLRHLFN